MAIFFNLKYFDKRQLRERCKSKFFFSYFFLFQMSVLFGELMQYLLGYIGVTLLSIFGKLGDIHFQQTMMYYSIHWFLQKLNWRNFIICLSKMLKRIFLKRVTLWIEIIVLSVVIEVIAFLPSFPKSVLENSKILAFANYSGHFAVKINWGTSFFIYS